MATDPAFTVEWTVPSDDEEWGGEASEASDESAVSSCGRSVESVARDTTSTQGGDCERVSDRDPENLPPAPVLAARVDYLRSDRDAAERRVTAVRDRYERVLAARNAEIRELRESRSRLQAFVDRVRDLF
jgi:hypothetical protein